jgi:hypothetical protein
MISPSVVEVIGATLFAFAVIHTFSTRIFEKLAQLQPRHAGVWHLLGEVEVVFGFWALLLVLTMFALEGRESALHYLDTRNFTEPMFVFAIMVIAGSRPILHTVRQILRWIARVVPLPAHMSAYFVILALVPLLGSFITEPAAMTLAAMILSDRFFSRGISTRLRYATLGVLFVNISIGGTLTPFAAPPVLMVASAWGWDTSFMLTQIGWKTVLAVSFNALAAMLLFNRELRRLPAPEASVEAEPMPLALIVTHALFLIGVVVFSHHAVVFMSLFLFFLGVAQAYQRHQDPLILREGLMVAFFLAGLVVLGGMQKWWLSPLLMSMSNDAVFFGTAALTGITDNAALTYLGSLSGNLNESFRYALVTGAVTGGGLTIIANAPNPAGLSILRGYFDGGEVSPLGLLVAAALPTVVAAMAFRLL